MKVDFTAECGEPAAGGAVVNGGGLLLNVR